METGNGALKNTRGTHARNEQLAPIDDKRDAPGGMISGEPKGINMTKDQLKKYPKNWGEISKAIRQREGNRCKFCNVPNYALGYRDFTGKFIPAVGPDNITFSAGQGELPYKLARNLAVYYNRFETGGPKYIVIILTVAHLDQDTTNNDPANLAALCQRCHLNHDRKDNQRRKREKKNQFLAVRDLFEEAP